EIIFHPQRWERLVWVAPHGAGRSIAGQWLTARGLAKFHPLKSPFSGTAPSGRMPEERPLFIELGAATDFNDALLGPGVCVSVPAPWEPPNGFADCVVVRSPPIGELVEPLVKWARARLAERSEVDAAQLTERLAEFVRAGFVES